MSANDVALRTLEDREKRFFAYVVFSAKIITWTALLALMAISEWALVVKVYHAEFSLVVADAHALGIPAKLNACSEGKSNGIPG
jgi:hypothetical protein